MKANVSYSLILNKVQADYEKRGFSATVKVGQFVASEVELSRLWKCDRKTVSRVLDQMNQVGLISTTQSNRTSVHTLLCVGSWLIDGETIKNSFFKRLSER